jgi:hypothetical protein
LVKVKSKIPDFERGNAKVATIPIVIGTGIHPLRYFEDYNLKRDAACPAIALSLSKGDGGRLAKRAVCGWTLVRNNRNKW